METKTLQQQWSDHEIRIHKKFRKEYYVGLGLICFSFLLSMGLNYYFLWRQTSFWFMVFIIIFVSLLFMSSHMSYVTSRKNNELVRLDRDYHQAQDYQKMQKTHPGGELSYDSVWSYPFTW